MAEKLAIEGGSPVRAKKWPEMWPGGLSYGEEEAKAVYEVAKAQSPFRWYGVKLQHKVDQLEKAYAEFTGTRYALAVGSGSTALTVALAALGVGPGTEVIIPSFMWISDVNSVVWLRAIPIIAEINDTLNLDPEDLEKKITPRTKAIIAIHMVGSAADMDAINKVAAKHNIPVLEDCSQATGATIGGRTVGSMSAIGTASFQYNKNMTVGEGGMITTDDENLFRLSGCFADVGFERDETGVSKPKDSPYESFGIGTRMDELRGAAALEQLKKLPQICDSMRRSQQRIWDGIKDIPALKPRRLVDKDGDSGAWVIWFNETPELAQKFRDAVSAEGVPAWPAHGGVHQFRKITTLLKKKAVTSGGCPWDCPLNKGSKMDYKPDDTPKSNALLDRVVTIPVPPTLTEEDADDAIAAIRKAAQALL